MHRGLQQYLVENNQRVVNLSKPGGNNSEISARCINYLENNKQNQEKIRFFIIFLTEWQRDMVDPFNLSEIDMYALSELKSRWPSRFYMSLSTMSLKFQIPVYIIGGASDTIWISNFEKEYPGIKIICQSMTNLLIADNPRIDNPIMSSSQNRLFDYLVRFKNSSMTDSDKEFIIEEIKNSTERVRIWEKNTKWFFPDGIHPNRFGHKKLFDYLCSSIPDLII